MLDACGGGCVLLRVAIGRIGSDLGGNVVPDSLGNAIAVGKKRSEMVVKGLENVAYWMARSIPLQTTMARALPLILLRAIT
jgi:hypothetical protein